MEVYIVGAGGHSKVIVDIIEQMEEYTLKGLFDDALEKVGQEFLGYPVLGTVDEVENVMKAGNFEKSASRSFLIVAIGENDIRCRIFEDLRKKGFDFINAVHPEAVINSRVELGRGNALMAGAVINSDTVIGDNTIINTGATLDHDNRIEDHVHISPGANLGGEVTAAKGSHIGIGASIMPGVTIGAGAIVGAGAVVLEDVRAEATVIGVPAREV